VPDILFITELYYPEETSTGYFVTGIAEGLAAEGASTVRVLCSQPTYSRRGERAAKVETRNGVRIRRLAAPGGDKNRLPGRLWNALSLTLRFGWAMLFGIKRGDRVLVSCTIGCGDCASCRGGLWSGCSTAGALGPLTNIATAFLRAPDIVALQEIQDDSGEDDDGTLSAEDTLQAIVDAIAAAGGPTYAFASAELDVDGETGGAPGSNIRNAFLWNPERTALSDLETLELGNQEGDPFFETRDPLIGTFNFQGEEVTVINNHFSSRFGSTPIFGGPQPFVQAGEDDRAAQAQAVNDRVDAILAQDPDAKVIVAGDLNTFEFTDEITDDLQGVGDERVLANLINDVPEGERYTFNFEGNSQVLDHILATENLASDAEIDIVHTNVDFPDPVSDHEPVVAGFGFAFDGDLVGGAGDDDLVAPNEPTRIGGRAGDDRVQGGTADDSLGGGAGNDTVTGGEGDDRAFGSPGDDVLRTGPGDDIAVGGTGLDTVEGGDGDDRLFGSADDDVLEGGAGADRVDAGSGDDVARGDGGADSLRGRDGDDALFGGEGNDGLSGDSGNDTVFGDEGDDFVIGGAGDDVVIGGEGNDRVIGRAGNDIVGGGAGDDVLAGNAGNDSLTGEEGDDVVFGGAGDDELLAGSGVDILRGGAGADLLYLSEGDGVALTPDFEVGVDHFVLPDAVAFEDLVITQNTISVGSGEDEDVIARINGLGDALTAADFINAADLVM